MTRKSFDATSSAVVALAGTRKTSSWMKRRRFIACFTPSFLPPYSLTSICGRPFASARSSDMADPLSVLVGRREDGDRLAVWSQTERAQVPRDVVEPRSGAAERQERALDRQGVEPRYIRVGGL